MNSREAVIEVLQAAASQDINLMKNAESQLKIWEVNPGFYSTLMDIFLLKNLDVNIRWMSIICLKNGIAKYWRKTGPNCLCEEEKQCIRGKIATVFDEEVMQLATQLAVIVGKIARIDIRQWPDVIQQALEAIKLNEPIYQHRALLTLNRILKELASKRLMSDQLVFREIASKIFDYLAQLSNNYFSSIFNASNITDLNASLVMGILVTKVLRKLVVHGGKEYSSDSIQIDYLKLSLQRIHMLMSLRTECNDVACQEKIEKLLIFLMKILSEMQEQHTLSYIPVLEETIKLCLEQIFASTISVEFSSFIIYCGNILRSIIRTYKVRKNDSGITMKNAIEIRNRILTKDYVKRLCQHLIMNYFPLSECDLEEWNSDPEGYMLVEAGESHKFLLRPCIEALFVSLFYEYRNEINPFILNLTKELDLLNMNEISDQDTLKVSAIYTAVGLASYELFHDLDFDMWCETKLFKFMLLPLKPIPVLQQHILWMIGKWINVKFSRKNRINLYGILLRIFSTSENLVLKLTACRVLRSAIDDFDFNITDFAPSVNEIFIALCKLLVQVDLCDTKMILLNSISIMIERIEDKVQDNADLLLECLPQLWEISEEHNLLRGAVVNVLLHLVKGLGNESMRILQITLPIIEYSTSVDQPAHVYLLEDGLELWLAVMKTTKHLTRELVLIYKNILVLLERASETFSTSITITRMYLLIDAEVFLKEYSSILSKIYSQLLGSIKDDAALKIVDVVKISLRLLPTQFLSMFQPNVIVMLQFILRKDISPLLLHGYLIILAYIILHEPVGFTNLFQLHCKSSGCNYEEVMERFLDIWIAEVDYMMFEDKKVSMLALSSFLPYKFKFIFDRFAVILDAFLNVTHSIQKTQDRDEEYVSDSVFDEKETYVDKKEREVISTDPARTVNLVHYFQNKLNETKQSYGEQRYAEALQTLNPSTVQRLVLILTL